ncbi:MAG: hypothetical protein HWQ38_24310 [Nostoc sp. NMS7]|uniref:hypothetical protein n=1 Tax=Nostoc sp. NMS7 TaxID=2815391 RepID=UPI0025FE0CC0|nr:hypothetical protein [Nostoc sp. NMS7]MBN3949418.1 hypothetical protein [Nostoc sp. NMS7]
MNNSCDTTKFLNNEQLVLILFWYKHPNEIIYEVVSDGWQLGDKRNSSHGWVECVLASRLSCQTNIFDFYKYNLAICH